MSEPKPPKGDGTEILDVADLVEVDASQPRRRVLDDVHDAWFEGDPAAADGPQRRADTLDAFLDDLEREPTAPKSASPAKPPALPEKARPKPPRAVDDDDPLAFFRPEPGGGARRPTPTPSPPPPVSAAPAALAKLAATAEPPDDTRLVREVAALAGSLPSRAALVQAFRARVAADLRGDLEEAHRLCTRARELGAETRAVAMTSRWIASARGDVAATIAAAHAELPLAGDASERLALLWQIATLDPGEAALRHILELDARDAGAWLGLAALAMQRKSWALAADAWEALGGRTEDDVARAAFFASAGGLEDAHLGDPDRARRALDRALESDPASAAAHANAQSIYLRAHDTGDLARAVALEAQRVGDLDPALAYHEHAGDLAWECMRDATAAAARYEHAATLAHSDVVQLGKLASLYEQEGRHAQLASVYERLLERIHDPQRRGAVLHRLATLYQTRLDRPDDAVRCYRAALDAVPTLAPAAQSLAQLYLAQRRWNDAAQVLLVEVDRLADTAVRAARYVAIAELLEAQVGATPQVVTLLERALALDPGQTAALDSLDRIYRATDRWNEIIALHEAQLAQTSHALRARALRLSLANLYLDRANAPDKAAEQLRAAIAGPPDRFFMLVALARALAEAGKWTEHVAVLEQQAKLVGDGVELVATLYRIATIVESRLGDPGRALAAYRRVLESQPRHELALHAMLRIHRAQSHWEDVIATERQLLELIERPEEAAVIHHRIALVAEDHLGRQQDAVEAYEAALRQLPSYRPARVALERLLRAAGRFDRLAQVLQEQAAAATGADRARLLSQAATVRELHCEHQTPEAIQLYEEALAVEGALPTALWGLHRIRVAAADWKAAAATLGLLVRQARHDTTRARLLVQLARLHELRLGDPSRATELLGAALSAEATPATVFERLRLALGQDDVVDAARWLEEAARVTTDGNVASGMLRLRASLLEHTGGDGAHGPADAYVKAYTAGGSAAVLEGLARTAYAGAGATARDRALLGDALARRAHLIKDPAARALLFCIAGTLHGDGERAETAYDEAIAAQPDFMPALAGRRALAEAAGAWATAAKLCAEQAAIAMDDTNKVELFEQAASTYIDHLGDTSLAIAFYRQALAVEPGRPIAIERSLELLEADGDWGAAAALINDQAPAVRDDQVRADLLARRAKILAERLGDAEGAIACIERALVVRPLHPELLTLLATLHESVSHWAEAARAYDQLATSDDPAYRHAALVAEARIWTTEVPDYGRAQRLLEAARALDPSDRRVIADLAEIAARAGDTRRAAELFGELAKLGPARERVTALLASVELRRRIDEPPDGDGVAAAFDLVFEDPTVIPMLHDHYRARDDRAGFVAAAEAALGRAAPGTPNTTPLRVVLGKLFARELAPPERAAPYLRAAVDAAPDDPGLRCALAGALIGRDDPTALAELRRAIDLDPVDPLPYQRVAQICTRADLELAASLASSAAALLGDDDALARTYTALLAIDAPRAGALSADDAFATVVGSTRVGELRRVVEILDPYLHAIFPEQQRQLAAATEVPEKYGVVGTLRQLAAALGVPELAIVWRDRAEPAALASDPRAFVFSPDHATESARPRIRFDAGCAIARIAGGATLATAAPAGEVRALFAAIDDRDAEDLLEFRRRIDKALPRRARKELERTLAEGGAIDAKTIATWDAEEHARAARVGLVAAGDVRAAAMSLCPDALAGTGGADRRARIRANPRMLDLLRFGVSDACWAACKRLYGRA